MIVEQVEVCNKDIPILSSGISIRQEMKNLEERLLWMQEGMLGASAIRYSGMPSGGGSPKGLDDQFVKLYELEAEYDEKRKEYARLLLKIEHILGSIESMTMRSFVSMKYVMNDSDTKIQRELGMSRRGIERAKKCIEEAENMKSVKWKERYILKSDEN